MQFDLVRHLGIQPLEVKRMDFDEVKDMMSRLLFASKNGGV